MNEVRVKQENTLKIRAEAVAEGEYGLHSTETKAGVEIGKELIEKFSVQYSEATHFYTQEIIKKIPTEIGDNVPRNALEVLIRRAMVPLTHFYWNQVMRIQSFASENENFSFYSPVLKEKSNVQSPEEFEKKVLDPEFNEFIISFLSPIWPDSIQSEKPVEKSILNLPAFTSATNHLFSLGRIANFSNKLFGRIEKVLRKFIFFSKFPILTFANSETALRLRGMYLLYFRLIDSRWEFPVLLKDEFLRTKVFESSFQELPGLNAFFLELGLSDKQIKIAYKLFREFIISYFPLQFLEGVIQNYKFASKSFLRSDRKFLFSSGDGDTFSTYLIASAKGNGFKIIKAQHGGHYGYYRDNRPALDIELPSTDIFLTWGWTKMHSGAQLEKIESIPMPSPWLSERKLYWKGRKIDDRRKYDLLWMPQMMKRFVGAPQGASSIRRDVIQDFSKFMISMARGIREKNLKAFIKPYNATTVALLQKTYQTIENEGSNCITVSNSFDKGLTRELLQDCSIVLWDQPGTGFLECLSCEIPTLVYWDRLYCEEEEWTKSDFELLENYGIIHRSISSLLEEATLLLKDPTAWMENKDRKFVVDSFCRKYALTSENWSRDWVSYLRSLE